MFVQIPVKEPKPVLLRQIFINEIYGISKFSSKYGLTRLLLMGLLKRKIKHTSLVNKGTVEIIQLR